MKVIWNKIPFEGIILVLFMLHNVVESVVATEWSITDEFVMAWINVTYLNPLNGKLHTENTEVGKYGTGKISSANGVVVHVRSQSGPDGKINHYGCESFINPIPDGPWIALIKRGNCNFDVKLQNAQARNALAMIVYDLEDRESLEQMGLSKCRNCSIPGIFTYKKVGEEIANVSDGGTRVDMFITVGETCTRPYSGINRTSVLFVSISFIVLMIISLAWLVFYYVQRFRYLHAKDRLAQRLCNAAKKALAKIPTRNIKLTDKELNGEAECCAVCIEFYTTGDVLRTLPCRHEFHKCCVDPWLLEHRTCPMCKMDILKYYGFIFTGSQESILHMEDGVINSESRETDSPTHDPHNQTHIIRFPDQTNDHQHHHSDENPHSSTSSSFPYQQNDGVIRKPSLISLTVVAAPRNHSTSPTTPSGPGVVVTVAENCTSSKNDELNRSNLKSDSSPEEIPSLPEYHHPMCFVHGDRASHYDQEDSDSVNPSSCHHHPLIHREGSGHQSHSNSIDKATSTEKLFSTTSESQSTTEDGKTPTSEKDSSPTPCTIQIDESQK